MRDKQGRTGPDVPGRGGGAGRPQAFVYQEFSRQFGNDAELHQEVSELDLIVDDAFGQVCGAPGPSTGTPTVNGGRKGAPVPVAAAEEKTEDLELEPDDLVVIEEDLEADTISAEESLTVDDESILQAVDLSEAVTPSAATTGQPVRPRIALVPSEAAPGLEAGQRSTAHTWPSPLVGGYADAIPVPDAKRPSSYSLLPPGWELPSVPSEYGQDIATRPSLATTPSMVPALRAVARTRRHAVLVAVCLALLVSLTAGAFVFTRRERQVPGVQTASSGPGEQGPAQPGEDEASVADEEVAPALGGVMDFSGRDLRFLRRQQGSGDSSGSITRVSGSGGLATGALSRAEARDFGGPLVLTGAPGQVGTGGETGLLRERNTRERGRGARDTNPRRLSAGAVRDVIERNSSAIRRCHEQEMRRASVAINESVVVRIRVGPSGVVQEAQVQNPGLRRTSLGRCIERSVERWRFPESSGVTEIESPFNLISRALGSNSP